MTINLISHYNDTQQNVTQCDDIWHHTAKQNDTQQNDFQRDRQLA
jgi:hypothetical protein